MTEQELTALAELCAGGNTNYDDVRLAEGYLALLAERDSLLQEVKAQMDGSAGAGVLQAVLDAIKGTLDPHTQIADHPNVKFAQMQRLKWADAAEMLWIVIANVSEGDWTKQSPEWQEAAARWRDNYFAAMSSQPAEHGEVK